MPALSGSSLPVRLPALFVNDDLDISGSVQGTLDGNILANDELRVAQSASGPDLAILGKVTADDVNITGRDNWELISLTWLTLWTTFNSQPSAGRIDMFPVWLGNLGLSPTPTLTIKPNPTPLTAHWQDLTAPIYVPASGDTGLRWDLVRWNAAAD
jgi:hypothetical protein